VERKSLRRGPGRRAKSGHQETRKKVSDPSPARRKVRGELFDKRLVGDGDKGVQKRGKCAWNRWEGLEDRSKKETEGFVKKRQGQDEDPVGGIFNKLSHPFIQ